MSLSQSLQQKLLQKLSPQQIQLMKLLQIPTANLEERVKEELEENRYDDYDNQISLLPPLESEAVRLLIEPDLKPSLTLSFSETGRKMILRRAYIRLMWLKKKQIK